MSYRSRKKKRKQKPDGMEGVTIRIAAEADVGVCAERIAEANAVDLRPPLNVADAGFLGSVIESIRAGDTGAVLVAEREERVIGVCILTLDCLYYNPEHKIAIAFSRWVDPEFRGRGIGSGLLRKAESISADMGATSFMAAVRADTPQLAQGLLRSGYRLAESYYVKGL